MRRSPPLTFLGRDGRSYTTAKSPRPPTAPPHATAGHSLWRGRSPSQPRWLPYHHHHHSRNRELPAPLFHFSWLPCDVLVVPQTFVAPSTPTLGATKWLMRPACKLWDHPFTFSYALAVHVETRGPPTRCHSRLHAGCTTNGICTRCAVRVPPSDIVPKPHNFKAEWLRTRPRRWYDAVCVLMWCAASHARPQLGHSVSFVQ